MKGKWKLYLYSGIVSVVIPLIVTGLFTGHTAPKVVDDADTQEMVQDDTEDPIVRVLCDDGSVQLFPMNDYLVGVVLSEMPADFEIEALKAQAVVARTYTLRRQGEKTKHNDADVCTNSNCCQGYVSVDTYLSDGGEPVAVEKIKDAVLKTDGEVLLYNGDLIEATYFSCSGGMTEDAADVWGSDLPYLQATESPGEEHAAHYTETLQFSADQFSAMLGRNLEGTPGNWIQSVSYTTGGGVDMIRICNVDYKGTQMRNLLGLRSTAFVISIVGDTVTITTKGFGHRVGMSQYGADAMAVQGYSYVEILQHYYQGTTLTVYKYE